MRGIKKEFGKHFLVELIDCNPDRLKYVKSVKKVFLAAARKSKAKILSYDFHQFSPSGVTGIIFIQESHFSVHTWPEERYAAFDIFTCGDMKPDAALQTMALGFQARRISKKIIQRGF